jgi:ligand-binding sensor domain-containing protein
MNNDGEVYRMNTRTEEFINFNEISAAGPGNYTPVNQIYCFSGGETWLQTEAGTCIRVISTASSPEYRLDRFVCRTGNESPGKIKLISKDSRGTVWILTSGGLFSVRGNDEAPVKAPAGNKRPGAGIGFFCIHEAGDRLWFGSGNGSIMITDTEASLYEELNLGVSSDIKS